ncbi:hypothetical protein [Natronocalculus amylovorans]|uniref:Uncharacterized protein n=1 Tax=Natronocalculus amylovorans TaxID=2917812 RepID=A0AAE3FYN9_9EURY|nr:hypothetical protein [Natronocalculus amylovorans]MCL9817473.1 hypothetical protein [Natronocalculus amylovorans]
MSTDSEPDFRRGSIAVRIYTQLRSWSHDSIIVTSLTDGAEEPPIGVDRSAGTVESERSESQFEMPTAGPRSTSTVYRVYVGIRRFVESSWLYRWLTAEPDSEVIVIDLRETFSAGPVLRQLDRRIRDVISVIPSSLGLRNGFQLRSRFVVRPLRVCSFVLLVSVLAGLSSLVLTGADIGISTFLLLALLLVAVRGTQSTRSLAAVQATWWYERVSAAIESSVFMDAVDPPPTADDPESMQNRH